MPNEAKIAASPMHNMSTQEARESKVKAGGSQIMDKNASQHETLSTDLLQR
jgi:hypothetical protein